MLLSTFVKLFLVRVMYILFILWQYDAFEVGIITTDDFTNADILEATYPAVAKRLLGDWDFDPAIPIVTGFLGKVFYLLTALKILLEELGVLAPLI